MRWVAAVVVVVMLCLVTIFSPSVYADEFTTIEMDLQHAPGETPTDIINVGADYAGQDIIAYQTWLQDYRSAGLSVPEGSYVGSFFAESLLKFDYCPVDYNSWKGQHSFLFVSKNFKFTYEEIMSGSTKWTVKLPVLADCIMPQGFPSVVDTIDESMIDNTHDYMVDILKCYPPKFAIWETDDEIRTNVTFFKVGDRISYTERDMELTTIPMYLHDGTLFQPPDAQCNIYVEPDANSSKYYIHVDEDDNIYFTDDYHHDQNITGFMSNARIINDRIYVDMNYPIKPEINYTMSFACRLKSNPKVYFTEESGIGTSYTDLRIIELEEPDDLREPITGDDYRDVLSYYDFFTGAYFDYEEYNKSLDIASGWGIIFEEGYGNGLFGVQKQVRPGDAIAFRPYVKETEDNGTPKHLSVMLPFICDERINPDVFVTYGNTPLLSGGGIDYSMLGYTNGRYRWYSTDAATLDYDYDGIPNYLDPLTSYDMYGYEVEYPFYEFYGENPYFFTRSDCNYDGYIDFDWNETNNNDSTEYFISVDYTKPYYTPVMAFNASNNITILNTTETLVIDLDVWNEGGYHCNITVMNHEKIITVDKIGPLGTYEYNGPATLVIFWRGDTLNQTEPGWSDDLYRYYGQYDDYIDEYGNNVHCRNCLWLNYTLNFTTTNPSGFKWVMGNSSSINNQPENWERIVFPIVGGYRTFFYDTGTYHYGAPLFFIDREAGPIANYGKPFPWESDWTVTIPGGVYEPRSNINQYGAYDDFFENINAISVYDSLGNKYVEGVNYDLKIIGILDEAYRYIHVFVFKNIDIGTDVNVYVEMWLPKSYVMTSGFVSDYPTALDGPWLNGLNLWDIQNETAYLSMKERPLYAGNNRTYAYDDLVAADQMWNYSWSHSYAKSDRCYYNNLSWTYPGVAPTKMSDSDGINASDYLLFSTRSTFLQKVDAGDYLEYYGFGGDPEALEEAWDIYKEDGFICYVIFREYANITFLCYDGDDTNLKSTNLTSKFYFIGGKSDSWIYDQGNEYISDPTWMAYHVSNEVFHPWDMFEVLDEYGNLHDGLNAYGIIRNEYVMDRIGGGEIWNIDNEYMRYRTFMEMSGRMIGGDPFFDYYIPADLQTRDFTEVYYFNLWNSASLTDGEWTQVLVKPEYVWTSVPRFDTRISIGNFFITVTIPKKTVEVDALGGIDISELIKLITAFSLFGALGFVTVMKDTIMEIFRNIGDWIWDGLKFLYDGASQVPGWIMGAFAKLVEYIRAFGEWVKQALLEFVGFIKSLAEELLDFADFALQFVLFVFPFVGFMLVTNYYMMFLTKARLAMRNVFISRQRREFPDD